MDLSELKQKIFKAWGQIQVPDASELAEEVDYDPPGKSCVSGALAGRTFDAIDFEDDWLNCECVLTRMSPRNAAYYIASYALNFLNELEANEIDNSGLTSDFAYLFFDRCRLLSVLKEMSPEQINVLKEVAELFYLADAARHESYRVQIYDTIADFIDEKFQFAPSEK